MNEIPSVQKLQIKNSKKKLKSKSHIKYHSSNTIPTLQENTDLPKNNSNIQTINQTSKSFQDTNNNNNNNNKSMQKSKSRNSSKLPSSKIFFNTYNESSLLKNIQFLNSDNIKLREVLKELKSDLQEKEENLNESQKLIKKIKFEYTQILNQYKILEQEKNELKKENERLNKHCDDLNKTLNKKDQIKKQNEKLKIELNKTKDVLYNLKGNYININNNYDKIEKDMKYKQILINDLKIEGNKIVNMLQDRDLLIQEYSRKISELSDIIKQKDEQLKLMMNFSKELNNENKLNIKELTKQAVKTINIFYNSTKNKNEQNNINLVEIKNNEQKKDNNNNDFITNIFSNNNCSFHIDNAIKNDLYIPETGINYINKEFLAGKNFQACLLKTELYSTLIREFKLFKYISDINSKINNSVKELKFTDEEKKLKSQKNYYEQIYKSYIKTKNENSILKTKLNDLILYIKKLKKDFSDSNLKLKEKFDKISKNYVLISIKRNSDRNIDSDNEINNNIKKISELNKEIDKIKNINHNINEEILNKEEIINNLRNENNQLKNKLNIYRTNPNAENNFKYYNSFSTKDSSSQKILFSKNDSQSYYNKNNITYIKNYTNKLTNKNNKENILDSFNESLTKNNQEFLSKTYNKKYNNIKEKNLDLKEIKFNSMNFISENDDLSNILIKSNNKDKFINLNIEFQTEFSYINDNKNLMRKSLSKLFNENNNSKSYDIKNILSKINKFTSEIKEEKYINIINTIFNSNNLILLLSKKINETKDNISYIKEKFKNNNKDKKIKPKQFLDILNEIEKLLLYLFNQLNNYNQNTKNISPYLNYIFNMVSTISYNNPLEINNNNTDDISHITLGLNTLLNTSSNNNIFNSKNYAKDDILKANIFNQNLTKGSIRVEMNIRKFNQLFNINKKIFSSSELIKYRSIYEDLEIHELIPIFKEICQNFNKIIINSKFANDSDVSDIEEGNNLDKNKDIEMITDNNTYHIVNEKIFGLKKFEFNLKLFFELLKNYLVVFEIVFNQIDINNKYNNNNKEFENIINILYQIFEDSAYLNIDSLDDNNIFCRKLLLTFLLNQKEYLSGFICVLEK